MAAHMPRTCEMICVDGVETETYVDGSGPMMVILPSYGRGGGEDFDDLAGRVTEVGWKVVRPQPRGIGRSRGPMSGVTMYDLAADVANVIRKLGEGPAVILGHAFGNMLARLVATDHGGLVRGLILASAEASRFPKDVGETPFIAGDPSRSEGERLIALRMGFFASGHDARPWLLGWHPQTLAMQHEAAKSVPFESYWAGGDGPMMELVPACDPFKPKPFWHELSEQYPGRVHTHVIDGASHALFPEQPARVGDAVVCCLARWRA